MNSQCPGVGHCPTSKDIRAVVTTSSAKARDQSCYTSFPTDDCKKEALKETSSVVVVVDNDHSTSASSSASTSDNVKLEINSNDSSDEAKESEIDSCDKSTNDTSTTSSQTSLGKVSFSCDVCDIRVNSAAQLAQVSRGLHIQL